MVWALILKHWKGALIGLAIAGALFAVWRYGASRYHAGEQAGKSAQADEDTQLYKSSISQRDALLAQAQADLAGSQARESQYAQTAKTLAAQLGQVNAQSAAASARVQQLPDTALFGDIREQLHQLSPNDPQPFTYGELRVIDNDVTQLPLRDTAIAKLTDTVKADEGQIAAAADSFKAMTAERDAWQGFGTQVEQLYIRAYNALDRRKRSARCLWVWKCTDKKLSFPAPTTLRKPA
jgi:small-conductance mechanosensitive channel